MFLNSEKAIPENDCREWEIVVFVADRRSLARISLHHRTLSNVCYKQIYRMSLSKTVKNRSSAWDAWRSHHCKTFRVYASDIIWSFITVRCIASVCLLFWATMAMDYIIIIRCSRNYISTVHRHCQFTCKNNSQIT